MSWKNAGGIEPITFTCGHCGKVVGVNQGFRQDGKRGRVYPCPFCDAATWVRLAKDSTEIVDQTPGSAYGSAIEHLPEELANLYNEARNCMAVGAYTPVVLACRKILMHVAVDLAAPEGKPFISYVKWLADNSHIPKRAEVWVNHIRDAGNEKNHEIRLADKREAELLLSFMEMLLKINYEFPGKVPSVDEEG